MSEPNESLSLETLTGVSETLLIPLFGRVFEYEAPEPILKDEVAHSLGMRLMPELAKSPHFFHQGIAQRRWPKTVQVMMSMRTRHFDRVAQTFIDTHPNAQVVMLGCGLDGRFQRLGSPDVDWVNLDLPAVMELRRQIFAPHPRVQELTISALDPAWLNAIDRSRPTLVIAEGLLMYLARDQIRFLYRMLADNLHGQFIAEVVAQYALPMLNHVVLRRALNLKTDTAFHGGLRNDHEPESWHAKLHWLHTWTLFDDKEKRLGLFNLLKNVPFAHSQWLVLYRLGD